MSQDEKIKDILNEINHMVDDLGWEKQRMSSSGRITYDKLINFLDEGFVIDANVSATLPSFPITIL